MTEVLYTSNRVHDVSSLTAAKRTPML